MYKNHSVINREPINYAESKVQSMIKKIIKKIFYTSIYFLLIPCLHAQKRSFEKIDISQFESDSIVHAIELEQQKIILSQRDAFINMNIALNMRNWLIGKMITEKQKEYAWGSNFLETLAHYLQSTYPGKQGFSKTSIFRMKTFYQTYRNLFITQEDIQSHPFFAIPWGHNIILLEKVKDYNQRLWYAINSKKYDWSRGYLEDQIKKDLYNLVHEKLNKD